MATFSADKSSGRALLDEGLVQQLLGLNRHGSGHHPEGGFVEIDPRLGPLEKIAVKTVKLTLERDLNLRLRIQFPLHAQKNEQIGHMLMFDWALMVEVRNRPRVHTQFMLK